jgi:hypothetical protein
MYKTRRLSLICLFALLTAGLAGQKNVSSPYARYGIGNLELQGAFKTLAMGGISSGVRNNLTLNYLTPASYSSIDTASFLFDFGIDYAVIRLKDSEQGYYSQDLGFSHLLLGFPIMKGWGFAAGTAPYSDGYYDIAEVTTPDQGTEIAGNVYEHHKGIGGYQKVFLGTAVSPFKYFSVGVNGYIVFGDINRTNDYVFTSDENNFDTRKYGTTSIRGISYEVSAQLMIPLPEKRFINAGATFSPSFSINTSGEELIMRYSTVQTSLYAFDTLYQSQTEATGRLPYSFRGGIAFGKKDKLTIGADVVYSGWSEAVLPGSYGTYANTMSLHAGAEYIPDKYSNYSFLNRMEYRIGCRYGESYALYDGDQVNEYGITFGAGIPLRKSFSRVSLFVDLSTRGNTDSNHFRETRISVGASLNLFDFWFLKAKYE